MCVYSIIISLLVTLHINFLRAASERELPFTFSGVELTTLFYSTSTYKYLLDWSNFIFLFTRGTYHNFIQQINFFLCGQIQIRKTF